MNKNLKLVPLGVYDVATQGGTNGDTYELTDGQPIHANDVVKDVVIEVITPLVGAGDITVKDGSANAITAVVPAGDVNSFVKNAVGVITRKAGTTGQARITVGTADLTAGKLRVWAELIVAPSG